MKRTNKRLNPKHKISPEEEALIEAREDLLTRARIIELGVAHTLLATEPYWHRTSESCLTMLEQVVNLRAKADRLLEKVNKNK